MKKTILISALAFAAAVFAGCSKENPNVSPVNESGDVAGSKVCAYIDKVKAHLDGVNMTWSQGDRMKVLGYDEWLTPSHGGHLYELDAECAGKSKGTFSLVEGQTPAQSENVKKFFGIVNGGSTAFSGGGSESAKNLYLKYSFPKNQNYVENGIEDNIMPLYAYGDALDNMQVYYCGSILSIQLYSKSTEDVYVSEIDVASPSVLAGDFYVNCYTTPTNPCKSPWSGNANKSIKLSVGGSGVLLSKDREHPTVFNLLVPGKQASLNMAVTIFTSEFGNMILSKSLDIVPGTIYRMAATEFDENISCDNVNLSLNGGAALCIDDVASIPAGTSTVKVTISDGKSLATSTILKLAALINSATEPGIITLDLSDVSFPADQFVDMKINWSRIAKLILPKSIRSFYGKCLKGVKDLVISEGITEIANSDLSGVTGTVSIPASVSSIDIGNNYTQSAYVVAEGNTAYQSVDGVLFNKRGETVNLVYYPGGNSATEYTIPSTVGGKSVTKVEYTAFQSCQNLETLTVPATITSMSQPFSSVNKLNKIILQGTETKLNSVTYNDSNLDSMFKIYNGTVICPTDSRQSYIDGTNGAGWKRLYELRNWTFDDGTSPMLTIANTIGLSEKDSGFDWE